MSTHHSCKKFINAQQRKRKEKTQILLIVVIAGVVLVLQIFHVASEQMSMVLSLVAVILGSLKIFQPTHADIDSAQEVGVSHNLSDTSIRKILRNLPDDYDWFTDVSLKEDKKDIDYVIIGQNGVIPIELVSWSNTQIFNPRSWFGNLTPLPPVESTPDTYRMKNALIEAGINADYIKPLIVRGDLWRKEESPTEGGIELGTKQFGTYLSRAICERKLSDIERTSLVTLLEQKAVCRTKHNWVPSFGEVWGRRLLATLILVSFFGFVGWTLTHPSPRVQERSQSTQPVHTTVPAPQQKKDFVYIDEKRMWYVPTFESEGCPYLHYVDIASGRDIQTQVYGCSDIPFASSSPFFIEYSSSAPFDFKTLYIANLQKGTRLEALNLPQGETLKAGCKEYGNWDPVCYASITYQDGKMHVDVYADEVHQPNEVYTNTSWMSAYTIDLPKVFGYE